MQRRTSRAGSSLSLDSWVLIFVAPDLKIGAGCQEDFTPSKVVPNIKDVGKESNFEKI